MTGGYSETLQLADGVRIESSVTPQRGYRLALFRRNELLVECRSDGATYRRRAGARTSIHEFRSIEQLRYDFERDAEDALDRD